jgi:hypothetical protein
MQLPGLSCRAVESLSQTSYDLRFPTAQEISGEGSQLKERAKSVIAQALSNSTPLGALAFERQVPFDILDLNTRKGGQSGSATLGLSTGIIRAYIKFGNWEAIRQELQVLKALNSLGVSQVPQLFGLAVHPSNRDLRGICMELLPLCIDEIRRWEAPAQMPYVRFHPESFPDMDFYRWMIKSWTNALDSLHSLGYAQVDVNTSNIMVRIHRIESIEGKPYLTLRSLSICLIDFAHANTLKSARGKEFYQWSAWVTGPKKVPCKVTELFGVSQSVLECLFADSGTSPNFSLNLCSEYRSSFSKGFRNDPLGRTGKWLLYWFTHPDATCPKELHTRVCRILRRRNFRAKWTDERVAKLDDQIALGPVGEWEQLKWDQI